jgi:hypothetical protein
MEVNVCRPMEIADSVEDASRLRKQQRRRMMKALRIISLLALLPFLGTGASWAHDCPDRPVTVKASAGHGQAPTILQVKPSTITVREGCSFYINIPRDVNVSTEAAQTWLSKKAQMNSPIDISVEKGTARDDPYKYKIVVEGIGELDPYVKVTH